MKDLTIPRWIRLARKLATRDPLWNKFVRYMYMGEEDEKNKAGYDEEDIEDWREEDWDVDADDEGYDEGYDAGDVDEEEWEVPQERQWALPTNMRDDEDDVTRL
jgi:hypothetical protein